MPWCRIIEYVRVLAGTKPRIGVIIPSVSQAPE